MLSADEVYTATLPKTGITEGSLGMATPVGQFVLVPRVTMLPSGRFSGHSLSRYTRAAVS